MSQHPHNPLQHWQALTRAANEAFAQERLDEASAGYRQALDVAGQLLHAEVAPDAAIAAYTVSCLNLAEAYVRTGDVERAAGELIGIHLRLLKMAADPTLAQGWRDAALCHSQRSHLELQHFLRAHEHPGIARLLQASHPPVSTLN
jgi:tetratricopeptide (TPR) repeat protein